MVSQALQILGMMTGAAGWLGVVLICVLPQWRVSAFVGANIVTAQVIWEGLWMSCVVQSTGQMQCKLYDSMLALSQDLQAARAMVVISILSGFFGLVLSVAGGKCTNCVEDEAAKGRVSVMGGVALLVGGLLCLTPVSWSAHAIIRDFYNPLLMEAQRRELGASLYVGWGSAGLLLVGGAALCLSCPAPRDPYYRQKFSASSPRELV